MKKTYAMIAIALLCFLMCQVLVQHAKCEEPRSFQLLWRVPVDGNIFFRAIGDVDGDGLDDVVVAPDGYGLQQYTVLVIGSDGSILWSKEMTFVYSYVGVADIDGDGKCEVILHADVADFETVTYAFDDDGTELWEFHDSAWGTGPIAFADLDLDGLPEIVTTHIGWANYKTHALDGDGSLMWEFNSGWPSYLMTGDVTGDGIDEVILSNHLGEDEGVTVLDRMGNVLWKHHVNWYGESYCNQWFNLGDLTGDGINDIAVVASGQDGTIINVLYTLKGDDGSLLWYKALDRTQGAEVTGLPPMVVADANEDGINDVILGVEKRIEAYRNDGQPLWSFRNETFPGETVWVRAYDINRDGTNEIIFVKDCIMYGLTTAGEEAFVAEIENLGLWNWHVSGLADVNGDGFDELIIQEVIGGQYYVAAVLPPLHAPSAPSLSASAELSGVKLDWSEPIVGFPILSYEIYRGASSGSEVLLTSVDGSTHSYVDSSVSTSLYFYYVTAVNSAGEGPPSNEVKCSCEQSFLGIETVVNLESFTTKRSLSNLLGIFTVQQNFEIAVGGSLIHRFWAQNVIEVWPNPVSKSYSLMLAAFEIWESNDGGVTWSRIVAQRQTISRLYRLQNPLILRSTIEGDKLVMENNCKEYNYSLALNSYILGLRSQRQPEIVIVGLPSIPHMPPGTVVFKEPTKGHVDTYTRIGSDTGTWLQCENFLAILPHTGERSKNLKWSTSGDFQYQEGASDQGLFFWPDYDSPIVSPP